MDRRIANNFTVGLFVLIGFVGFVFILFNVGDGKGFFSSQYSLYGKFRDVKGLHSGSEISLSGLRVGVIKQITVAKDDSKELIVELSIDKNMQQKIRQDSKATIQTQGVLGDKYVEISIGTPSAEALKHGDTINTDTAEDLFSKSGQLMEGISRHFDKGGDIESLVKNLNQVAKNLVVLTSQVQREQGLLNAMIYGNAGAKLTKSVDHLEAILKKVDNGEGTLGAIINDPTLYEDVKYLLGGAKRSSILKYFMRSFIEEGEKEGKTSEKSKKSE